MESRVQVKVGAGSVPAFFCRGEVPSPLEYPCSQEEKWKIPLFQREGFRVSSCHLPL